MLKTLYLIILLSIVFFIAEKLGLKQVFHQEKWVILIFLSALSYLMHLLNTEGMANNGDKFINYYLVFTVIRFVGSLIFVAVYLILGVESEVLFILNFFALYLCFTMFEIINLYRNLRRFSEGLK